MIENLIWFLGGVVTGIVLAFIFLREFIFHTKDISPEDSRTIRQIIKHGGE